MIYWCHTWLDILMSHMICPIHGEVYLIQHYVIKFLSDLRQVGGFLQVLRFPPPIKHKSLYIDVTHDLPHPWWGVLDTTLCDKVCQWLATGRWFSSGTPISSTNKAQTIIYWCHTWFSPSMVRCTRYNIMW
jgi:hypothetical protein